MAKPAKPSERERLIGALARLRAHRHQVEQARSQLQERAQTRHDANTSALETLADHRESDVGGVMGQRHHATLATEQDELRNLIARKGRSRDKDPEPT